MYVYMNIHKFVNIASKVDECVPQNQDVNLRKVCQVGKLTDKLIAGWDRGRSSKCSWVPRYTLTVLRYRNV